MPFSESVKQEIKYKSGFLCAVCEQLGVDVHHIVPEEVDGPNTIENGILLCPTCHDLYDANPKKRKFLRDRRDYWYSICEQRAGSVVDVLQEILTRVAPIPTLLTQLQLLTQSHQELKAVVSALTTASYNQQQNESTSASVVATPPE